MFYFIYFFGKHVIMNIRFIIRIHFLFLIHLIIIERVSFSNIYSSLQYVNQCWESVCEREHKRKKMKIMLVYVFRSNFMSSTSSTKKIFENRCYVSRNQIRIFILLAKLLKTTVFMLNFIWCFKKHLHQNLGVLEPIKIC